MEHARTVALVTGASSGIGAAVADRLARGGRDLIVVARRRERLDELAARLTGDAGATVDVLVADLTDTHDLLERVAERVGAEERLDLLVNNAGFAGYGPSWRSRPTWPPVPRRARRGAAATLPGGLARHDAARRRAVVNVASLLALSGPLEMPMRGRATYAAAKSFLLTYTQLLAQELAGTGVQAMVCLPGMVESEFHGVGSANSLSACPS